MEYRKNLFFKLSSLYYELIETRLGHVRGITRIGMTIVKIGMIFSGEFRSGSYYLNIKNKEVALVDSKELIHLTRKEFDLISNYIDSIDQESVVYDIGSYHGLHTVIGSVADKVYSFEPSPANLKKLNKNIELNSGIELVERAVWDKEEEIKIKEQGPSSSVNQEGISKDSISLDSFVFKNGNTPPNVIKIDVEGAEYKVLQGAEKLLKEYLPVLILEVHKEEEIERFGGSKQNLENFLSELGYEKRKSSENHREHQIWKKTEET